MLDCEECECLETDDVVQCKVYYDESSMVLTDGKDREYRFEHDPRKCTLFCVEVIESRLDEDTDCLI